MSVDPYRLNETGLTKSGCDFASKLNDVILMVYNNVTIVIWCRQG